MRVEFRKSGGVVCEKCGSTDLVGNAKTGVTVEKDLWELELESLNDYEIGLLRLHRERQMEHESIARHEIDRTKAEMEKSHLEYEELVEALFAEDAPRYRVFKKRWLRGLREGFDAETKKLRDKTSKV